MLVWAEAGLTCVSRKDKPKHSILSRQCSHFHLYDIGQTLFVLLRSILDRLPSGRCSVVEACCPAGCKLRSRSLHAAIVIDMRVTVDYGGHRPLA